MLQYPDYIKIFISLLAILNPLGAIPIYISLISGVADIQRRQIVKVVANSVGLILLTALFLGEAILQFFGISINSFRVGGGILLLMISLSMLNARVSPVVQTEQEAKESRDKESVAVVPLAIPLLAGPGAISTVILDAHKGTGLLHYLLIAFVIIFLCGILWFVLRMAPLISRRISATGINIFTRIMGLILAAIAVEFIAHGLKELFPALK